MACSANPTEVFQPEVWWLYARNEKYDDIDSSKIGKWMLFVSKEHVDSVWNKIKEAVNEGHLWHSKVSASNDKPTHAIMIYTKDYTDLEDVIDVLDYLERSGIKSANSTIYYKTDQQTSAGIYSGGKQKASIYNSATIRSEKRPFYSR